MSDVAHIAQKQRAMDADIQSCKDHVTKEIEGLRTGMNEKFAAVDKRFDAVDKRFDAVDKRFDALEGRMDVLEKLMRTVIDHLKP